MDKLILIEPDDDLAECVATFFSSQYDVARLGTLGEVRTEMESKDAAILFVNVDATSESQLSTLERLREAYPRTRIVVTYLSSPAKGAWARKIREVAHIIVRKPYGVVDIDRSIRGLSEDGDASS